MALIAVTNLHVYARSVCNRLPFYLLHEVPRLLALAAVLSRGGCSLPFAGLSARPAVER